MPRSAIKRACIATLKHFAAHGQPESGTNCAPVNISERVLRETFLFTFKEAIQRAGAISVMASYNEIDGVPSHANRWLLRDVLRKEWGFHGFVVSDYYAITELHARPETRGHAVAKDRKQACELAVKAGVNIELPEPDCYSYLVELVKKGVLKETELDELVKPMLEWKFRLGLFEDPYTDPEQAERVVGCDEHRELALAGGARDHHAFEERRRGAARSRTREDHRRDRTERRPAACWADTAACPSTTSTVLEGIRAKAGDAVKVLYSEGCKITGPGSWYEGPGSSERPRGRPPADRRSGGSC